MKYLYTTIIAFIIVFTSFGNSIQATQNDFWNNTTAWNLNRLPQDGDSIIIPAGYTITLNENVPLDNVVLRIYGTLQFINGKLALDNNSQIIIETGGLITGINSNDQIRIGSTLKFSGTELSKSGYSIANSSTGTSPLGFVNIAPSILPVTFQSFYAARQSADIQLTWTTSAEVNNSHFAIERSTDGRSWKQVAIVLGAGNSSAVNKYSYTDKNISAATVYYRIRQVDIDGRSQYSAVRIINSNGTQVVTNVYASAKQTVTVDFNSDVKNNVIIEVINMNGQMIARRDYKQVAYRVSLNLPAAVAGIYVVRVSDANGWSEAKKIAL